MAQSVNKTILIGNLGDDPELRYTGSGTAVCNMSLATNETYTNSNGEEVQNTEWHDVVAWGRLGEVCNEYLEQGSQVYFEGKLETTSYEDQDGQMQYNTQVKALEATFLGSAEQGGPGGRGPGRQGGGPGGPGGQPAQGGDSSPSASPAPAGAAGGDDDTFEPDDDLPF